MAEELDKLHKQILVCKKCPLYKTRTKAVPGEGPDNAKIMFVGLAPGRNEDIQGKPFVGMAGRFLNKLLNSINLSRREIFITSVLKCFPPKNRAPKQEEVEACKAYLEKQIEIIQPKIIVTLGNLALQTLLEKNLTVSKFHGKPQEKNRVIVFPTFHPAAGMRFPNIRNKTMEDFEVIKSIYKGTHTPR